MDNDTNTVTRVGEGKGINNFVVVTIEDGLGMGVVIDGELYRGSRGFDVNDLTRIKAPSFERY